MNAKNETTQNKAIQHKGIPLIYCITALAAAATIALALLITSYTYYVLSQQEKNARDNQFETITQRIQKEINYRTTPLFTIAKSFASSSTNIENIAYSPYHRKEFLYSNTPTLLYYPTIFSINYTLNNGFFVYLVNLEHLRNMLVRGTINQSIVDNLQKLNIPSRTKYVLLYSDPVKPHDYHNDSRVKIECYNLNLDLLSSRYLQEYLRSTDRPWFTKTMESTSALTLTGPYLIPETQEQGITVSCALNDEKGAYAITTHLAEFMHFVTGSLQSLDGSIFVLDNKQARVLTSHPDPRHAELLENCEGVASINHNTVIHSLHEHNELINQSGYGHSATHTLNSLLKYYENTEQNEIKEDKKIVTINQHNFNFEFGRIKFAHDHLNILMLIDHQNTDTAMRTYYSNMILFTIIIIVIMIPIISLTTRKIGFSISSLSKEASRISQKDFNKTLPIHSNIREVQALANSMSTMKTQLKNYTEELQNIKGSLEEKVNEQTKDLQKALQTANDTTEAKGMFLSAMSHELRTPMNAILGFTYLFEKDNLTENQKTQLERIRFSGESLLHIINDILDFSKLESNKVEIEYIEFSLDELLSQTMDIMQTLAKTKGIELVLEKEENLPNTLIGDPNRLRQVFINLIGNAIKFTDKGYVKFIVQRTELANSSRETSTNELALSFHIKDTGIGMTEEQMSRLFQVFSQADSSIARKYGGSGLGLTISKQLINLMDGEITVKSKKNEGSQFTANANFKMVKETTPSIKTQKKEEEQKNTNILYKENALVLVVDDRQINLEVANALFKKYNIRTENAMSGMEAIEKVKHTQYDLICLDIQMPEMTGHEAAQRIRALTEDEHSCATDVKNVPIIAMTANAMEEDIQASKNAGMNEHLTKPITPKNLLNIIQTWLAIK